MSSLRHLRGGRLLYPGEDAPRPGELLIEGDLIKAVGERVEAPAQAEVLELDGRLVLPALFDMKAHLREPGREDQETLASAAAAALAGGITGLLAMPDTDPPIDSAGMIRYVSSLAREVPAGVVYTAGCLTKGREGKQLAELGDMHTCGARLFTDADRPVSDPLVFRRALEYARTFGLVVGSHPAVPALLEDGAINEGPASYRLGLPGLSAVAEEIAIARDVRLARVAGARLHIHQVSTARGLEIIRRFKEEGVAVTCEVTPHHLIFCEDDLDGYNTSLKINPPFRSAADREALLCGVADGTVDVIASSHAPQSSFEKNLDFEHAPFGLTGLETGLVALHDRLIVSGRLTWGQVLRAWSEAPRRLLGLPSVQPVPGSAAELVIFDPAAETLVRLEGRASRSHNTPFLGETLRGRVDEVLIGATTVSLSAARPRPETP